MDSESLDFYLFISSVTHPYTLTFRFYVSFLLRHFWLVCVVLILGKQMIFSIGCLLVLWHCLASSPECQLASLLLSYTIEYAPLGEVERKLLSGRQRQNTRGNLRVAWKLTKCCSLWSYLFMAGGYARQNSDRSRRKIRVSSVCEGVSINGFLE